MDVIIEDMAILKDKCYFSADGFNGLFEADLEGGTARLLSRFPGEDIDTMHLHTVVVTYESLLLFLPGLAENITLYHVDEQRFELFQYPVSVDKRTPKVAAAVVVGECAYIFGENYPAIIRFNFVTKEFDVFEDWYQQYKEYGERKEMSFFGKDIVVRGTSIFIKTYQNPQLIEYNTENNAVSIHKISERFSNNLAGDESGIWLFTEQTEHITHWNMADGRKELFECRGCKKEGYRCSTVIGDQIWIFPHLSENAILIFDKKTKKACSKQLLNKDSDIMLPVPGYVNFIKRYRDKVYFMCMGNKTLYACFCSADGQVQIQSIPLRMSGDITKERLFAGNEVVMERGNYSWAHSACGVRQLIAVIDTDNSDNEKNISDIGNLILHNILEDSKEINE